MFFSEPALARIFTVVFFVFLVIAPTATAKTINGTAKKDVLVGTKKADRINGKGGNDRISGKAGKDTLTGGKGKDRISGDTGNDKILAKDGAVDTIRCGSGRDSVSADAIDKIDSDCEIVDIPGPPTTGLGPTDTPTAALSVVRTGGGVVTSAPLGINCGITCTGRFPIGSVVTLTATPDANQEFSGWSGTCTGSGSCTVTVDGDKSVSAVFNQIKHELAVSVNGSGTVSSTTTGISCPTDCSELIDQGESITLTASPNEGQQFDGWSGHCSGSELTCVVNVNAAKEVEASFSPLSFNLTVNTSGTGTGLVDSSPEGIACGLTCTASFDYGTEITLSQVPAQDSGFQGWGGACSGTEACVVTITEHTTIDAVFTQINHALSVNKAGAGSGTVTSSPIGINCGSTCSANFPQTTEVTLTATPSEYSTFAGWSGAGCSGTGTCVVTMSNAASVTATFNQFTYPLSVNVTNSNGGYVYSSNMGGINCGLDCGESYAGGTVVYLLVVLYVGGSFQGWSGGGCAGYSQVCVVTMDEAKSVTANINYTPIP